MSQIRISLTAASTIHTRSEEIAVVIDVLRATSVIATALSNGAKWIMPVLDPKEAFERRMSFPDSLLAGERQTKKIPGFDLGNSPLEYGRHEIGRMGIILSTTNGTLAINQVLLARKIITASFLNLQAVVDCLKSTAMDLHLVCAGTNNAFSLDDFLCAGALISRLREGSLRLDDLGRLALNTWLNSSGQLRKSLKDCHHVDNLVNNGFSKDLEFCTLLNKFDVVPEIQYMDGFPILKRKHH